MASRPWPRPKRGTIWLTALCTKCDGVLRRMPTAGALWFHDQSGTEECDEPGGW